MKKVVFLFLLIIAVLPLHLYGALTAPYFGMNISIQGASYFSSSGDVKSQYRMQPMLQSTWDIKLGKKVFFLGQFGTELALGSGIYEDSMYMFTGLGVGWYVFDERVNNRGSSLTMSVSYITKMSLINKYSVSEYEYKGDYNNIGKDYSYHSSYYDDYLSANGLGAQLLVSYYYNIFKNFAIKVGFNLNVYPFETVLVDRESENGVGVETGLSLGIAF